MANSTIRIRTLDFPFSTEAEARYWRRAFVARGFEASGILDDWDRDVYTFTVYTVEDED